MGSNREQRRLVHLNGQLSAGEGWCSIVICNVSSRGLMGKCARPPAKGASVEVRHLGFTATGEVAWVLGERFGIVCPLPIDLAALHEGLPDVRVGRRSMPRSTVRIPGELMLRENVFAVLMIDLSQSGARVYMPAPPRPGVAAVLAWGQHERPCTVSWAKGDTFGVEFSEFLSEDIVRALRPARERAHDRAAAVPAWPKPQIPAHLHRTSTPMRRENRDYRSARRTDPLARRVRG